MRTDACVWFRMVHDCMLQVVCCMPSMVRTLVRASGATIAGDGRRWRQASKACADNCRLALRQYTWQIGVEHRDMARHTSDGSTSQLA